MKKNILLIISLLFTIACNFAPQKSPLYRPPEGIQLASAQRLEFVNLFLQGRWCEAEILFQRSLNNYIRQDDFCSAAKNYIVAYKLMAYIGQNDEKLLAKARDFAQAGDQCILFTEQNELLPTEKDNKYRKLIKSSNLKALIYELNREDDPLFLSVYARKASLIAKKNKFFKISQLLIRKALEVDRRQGWVIFLIEDWKIILSLKKESSKKKQIQKRINILYQKVETCSKNFF